MTLWGSFGDDPTLGHTHHPVADLHDHVHVVLDEQHRATGLTDVGDVRQQGLGERRVHARGRLVEHDQRRLGHDRARQFQ